METVAIVGSGVAIGFVSPAVGIASVLEHREFVRVTFESPLLDCRCSR